MPTRQESLARFGAVVFAFCFDSAASIRGLLTRRMPTGKTSRTYRVILFDDLSVEPLVSLRPWNAVGCQVPGFRGAHPQVPRPQPVGLQGRARVRAQLREGVAGYADLRDGREDCMSGYQPAAIQDADGCAGACVCVFGMEQGPSDYCCACWELHGHVLSLLFSAFPLIVNGGVMVER